MLSTFQSPDTLQMCIRCKIIDESLRLYQIVEAFRIDDF